MEFTERGTGDDIPGRWMIKFCPFLLPNNDLKMIRKPLNIEDEARK